MKAFNVVAMDYPGMKLNPHAPDVIEVDFERTIKMVNPEAKIYPWRKMRPRWQAEFNRCRSRVACKRR